MPSILFDHINIAGLELKNRLVRSATAEAMATKDGRPTPQLKELYCALAEGEVGLIITSGAGIEAWANPPETIGVRAGLAMHDDRFIADWPDIIEAVHQRGAKIAMQFGYMGRQAIPALRGSPPLAPSAVPIEATGVTPIAMTQADIMDLVEKFAQACRRIKEAEFDAAQIHGAHGNLVTNFMSPFTNRRDDQYGGSLENRARFVKEVMQRTRELVGPDFPIMIKLSFSDFVKGGLTADEAVQMAAIMADAGIDCIEVSGGTLSETPGRISVKNIKRPEQEAYFLPIAKALKKRVAIPVMLVGGMRTPEVMEKALQEGAADLLSLCRPLIREPGLFRRWKEDDREKATCVSCNECFNSWMFAPLRCFLDEPLTEEEKPENTSLP
jgi:2,4-dienoyl-CoA reductase-like NADH-dependent reductase (Old Yellow Enzyme family)